MFPVRALFMIGAGAALYFYLTREAQAGVRRGGFVDVQLLNDPNISNADFYAGYLSPWELDDMATIPGDYRVVDNRPVYDPAVWDMDDADMRPAAPPDNVMQLDYFNPPIMANDNLWAMLATIRYAEGTAGADGYGTLFGYGTFTDFSDHPANLGWKGVALPDAQCRAAGFSPGCVTTAAGAYQIVKPTWNTVANRLRLPDFSPESQDIAAIELIREKGAIPDVLAGRFNSAISKIRRVWASLPGAGYEQPERSLTALQNVYVQNGGGFA